jgi:hypothetical protein
MPGSLDLLTQRVMVYDGAMGPQHPPTIWSLALNHRRRRVTQRPFNAGNLTKSLYLHSFMHQHDARRSRHRRRPLPPEVRGSRCSFGYPRLPYLFQLLTLERLTEGLHREAEQSTKGADRPPRAGQILRGLGDARD